MNVNLGNGHEELPIKWVKERLKGLSMVEPSDSLKSKLVASIPSATIAEPRGPGIWLWSPGMRWASAAAVIIITASAVAWLGSPWGHQSRFAADTNSGPGRAYATDHNSLQLTDTNLCDINSLR